MSTFDASARWVLEYLLNSLWMVPLIFFAAWLAVRLARYAGPRLEHGVWVSALLLQIVLPAFRLQLSEVWRLARRLVTMPFARQSSAGVGYVDVSFGPGIINGPIVLPSRWMSALVVLYACVILYFAARLAWGVRGTHVMQRMAEKAVLPDEALKAWQQYCFHFRLPDVQIASTAMINWPVTVGIRHPALLLPKSFVERIDEGDLDAVMAHECAHMQRRDFAKNLLYRIVSLPVAYHPLLWLTMSRIAESREMVCDAMAADAVEGRESYARSLLRLASTMTITTPAKTLHAIGIFDANTFERRVMRLTRRRAEIGPALAVVAAGACVAVGAATCASAMAFRVGVASAPASAEPNNKTGNVKVSAEVMADNVIYQKPPVYPAQAKADKDTLDGPVVLNAIISKEGTVEKLVVKQSLRADYDASALDAVREWRYRPYLLNGTPVDVETTITVNFFLDKK